MVHLFPVGSSRVYLTTAFFWAAQRRLTASAMRARPRAREPLLLLFPLDTLGSWYLPRMAGLRGGLVAAEPPAARRARA